MMQIVRINVFEQTILINYMWKLENCYKRHNHQLKQAKIYVNAEVNMGVNTEVN